ncbi:GNAT family N-acetyltransferase [Ciceribacter sp. RN22]|nr:GNAT family N-acetyltransferase [Ciceribacter sp. RN22]
MFEFRPYRAGDEPAITALFQDVFGRPMSLDFWRWRFLDHPAGGPLVMLAFAGDTLVGHYAASHAPLSIHGEYYPAALSMTTMTHPEWRGRRLFERTAEAFYATLPGSGISAVYGFPNAAVHALRLMRAGWRDTYEVPTLILDVETARHSPRQDSSVCVANRIDERFDRFNTRVAADLPIIAHRSADILSWRVDRNPDNTYTRFVLEDGEDIAGYAITKLYGTDMIDLVEMRCADGAAARALINTIAARAAAEGRKRIATWCLPADVHRLPLEVAGFKAAAPVTYFGGRIFKTLPADLTDSRLWRLSMLDSDLY